MVSAPCSLTSVAPMLSLGCHSASTAPCGSAITTRRPASIDVEGALHDAPAEALRLLGLCVHIVHGHVRGPRRRDALDVHLEQAGHLLAAPAQHRIRAPLPRRGVLGLPAEQRLVEPLGAVGVGGVQIHPGERPGRVLRSLTHQRATIQSARARGLLHRAGRRSRAQPARLPGPRRAPAGAGRARGAGGRVGPRRGHHGHLPARAPARAARRARGGGPRPGGPRPRRSPAGTRARARHGGGLGDAQRHRRGARPGPLRRSPGGPPRRPRPQPGDRPGDADGLRPGRAHDLRLAGDRGRPRPRGPGGGRASRRRPGALPAAGGAPAGRTGAAAGGDRGLEAPRPRAGSGGRPARGAPAGGGRAVPGRGPAPAGRPAPPRRAARPGRAGGVRRRGRRPGRRAGGRLRACCTAPTPSPSAAWWPRRWPAACPWWPPPREARPSWWTTAAAGSTAPATPPAPPARSPRSWATASACPRAPAPAPRPRWTSSTRAGATASWSPPTPRRPRPGASLVTVIHDSEDELRALLGSVERHLPGLKVIVVDSGSADGGAEAARAAGATVIELGENVGYGRAVNAGLAQVTTAVTIVANPDLELVDGSLAGLAERSPARPSGCWPRYCCAPTAPARTPSTPSPPPRPSWPPAVIPPAALPAPGRLPADPWLATERAARGLGGRRLPGGAHGSPAPPGPVQRGHLPLRRGPRPRPASGRAGRRDLVLARALACCTTTATPPAATASASSCSPASAERWSSAAWARPPPPRRRRPAGHLREPAGAEDPPAPPRSARARAAQGASPSQVLIVSLVRQPRPPTRSAPSPAPAPSYLLGTGGVEHVLHRHAAQRRRRLEPPERPLAARSGLREQPAARSRRPCRGRPRGRGRPGARPPTARRSPGSPGCCAA